MKAKRETRRVLETAIGGLGLVTVAALALPFVAGNGTDPVLPTSPVRAAAHDTFSLSSPVVLLAEPRVVLERGTVSLATKSGAKARTTEALYALLTGGRASLVVEDAVITIDRSGERPLSEPEAQLAPMAVALAGASFSSLSLRNGMVRLRTPAGEHVLTNVATDIALKKGSSVAAKGTVRYAGETLAVDLALSTPGGTATGPLSLAATVKGDILAARLDGRLDVGTKVQLTAPAAEVSVPDLRAAARWLGAPWPAGQGLGAAQAQGALTWSDGTISFADTRFTLDGNVATGGLSLSVGANRPAVEGTLAFETLNLAPYVAQPQAKTALAYAADWLSFARLPLGATPSLILALDTDLRISATDITAGGQSLGRCAASLAIKDGRLFADLAEIEFENGGTGQGQIGVDMTTSDPTYTFRGRFDDVEIGKAATVRLGRPVVDGVADVTVDLAGSGRGEDAVLASLSGSVALEMAEGARLGMDLAALPAAAAENSQDTGWQPLLRAATDVDDLVARLAFADGSVTLQTVTFKVEDTAYLAAGGISIPQRAIDVTLSSGAMPGADPAATGTATPKAFRIRGPWVSPTVRALPPPGKSAANVPGDDRG